MHTSATPAAVSTPSPAAVLELLKPVTWFPPMWAFACGAVSSGADIGTRPLVVLAGVLLAGPLLCATSQAVNDWYDRHVDAINEPHRPIPSGRVPGRWGLAIAIAWSVVSMLVAASLGPFVFAAAALGLVLAWAYSAPPLRLKRNGWWGNSAVALSYEGLPWVTGAAVMLGGAAPPAQVFVLAALYSAGAHGIMTLNDFKAIEGDVRTGVRSLPVRLGAARAARVACWAMVVPQVAVAGVLLYWARPGYAAAVLVVTLVQMVLMVRLLRDPRAFAPWYNATGVSLYVSGMLISAFALAGMSA